MIVVSEHCEFIHMPYGMQLNPLRVFDPAGCTSGTIRECICDASLRTALHAIDAGFPPPLRCGPCRSFAAITRITPTAYRVGVIRA
jgi:hypothetical protein